MMIKTGIKNDALMDALHAMRDDQNETTENNYTQALLQAQLLAPVGFTQAPIEQADGSVVLPEGSEVRFVTFADENENMIFPVFSDDAQADMGDWDVEDTVYPYPMTIEQYLPMVFDEEVPNMGGLVLNPFSEDGMPITMDNLAFLASVLEAVHGDGEVQVSAADDIVPGPLKYDLVALADDHSDLIKHLYLLRLTQGEEGSYLVVIDGPDREAALALGSDFEKVFNDNAGDEGSEFNLIMSDDFGADLSEFTPIYDSEI
ncbi:SseB family protein [Weissella viridescens]|uniref:SseB family protein n=1 Tax=Weissella viridescens TaxID=1629 RepID=UPI00092F6BF7|nr:SseB family protein [Weissella viridescens]